MPMRFFNAPYAAGWQ